MGLLQVLVAQPEPSLQPRQEWLDKARTSHTDKQGWWMLPTADILPTSLEGDDRSPPRCQPTFKYTHAHIHTHRQTDRHMVTHHQSLEKHNILPVLGDFALLDSAGEENCRRGLQVWLYSPGGCSHWRIQCCCSIYCLMPFCYLGAPPLHSRHTTLFVYHLLGIWNTSTTWLLRLILLELERLTQ